MFWASPSISLFKFNSGPVSISSKAAKSADSLRRSVVCIWVGLQFHVISMHCSWMNEWVSFLRFSCFVIVLILVLCEGTCGDEVAMRCVAEEWRVFRWGAISFRVVWFRGAVCGFGSFECVQALCCGHVWFSWWQWVNYGILISFWGSVVEYITQIKVLLKRKMNLLNHPHLFFPQVSFFFFLPHTYLYQQSYWWVKYA